MRLCVSCQSFIGHHSHNAPYHDVICECDGSDKSRVVVVDESDMLTIRINALTDEGAERGDAVTPGVYTGKDVLPWQAMTRRLAALLGDRDGKWV